MLFLLIDIATERRFGLHERLNQQASKLKRHSKKRNFEFVIPTITNPNGGKAKETLSEQMDENEKYLKKLQDDMMQQVDKVNNETIEQQPMDKDLVNKSVKFPQKIRLEPLQKLFPDLLKPPLLNPLHQVPVDFKQLGIHRNKITKHLDLDRSSTHPRDLIGNMNIVGNMDHLKKLMKHMANDVLTANKAMGDRTRKKNEERTEALTKQSKNKEKS